LASLIDELERRKKSSPDLIVESSSLKAVADEKAGVRLAISADRMGSETRADLPAYTSFVAAIVLIGLCTRTLNFLGLNSTYPSRE